MSSRPMCNLCAGYACCDCGENWFGRTMVVDDKLVKDERPYTWVEGKGWVLKDAS